ncbi:hypothetical protein SAICODRAFT_93771 [Saitoella complicata NRRL Y-17804]|nr:uncharacterized protein SAICODRAFT_93771 [Saitoella complicata NRRL Y-17804]ODQ52312.1 hypothetical protein SAICODRAFT_93771 [Saitoella complicata NRRL Y-17804]
MEDIPRIPRRSNGDERSHSSRDARRDDGARPSRDDRGGRDDRYRSSRDDRDSRPARDGDRDRYRSSRDDDRYRSSRDERDRRDDRYRSSRDDRDARGGGRDERRDRDGRDDRRRDGRDDRRRDDRDGRDDRYRSARDEPNGRDARDSRRRSRSPEARKSPTPDLTDVIRVDQRQRRMTMWDIKPTGYESVTAEQAKMSGMFPLPGAPRGQVMNPAAMGGFPNQRPAGASGAAPPMLTSNQSRQSRRLYVSDMPSGTSESSLRQFFNDLLNSLNVNSEYDPCDSATVEPEKGYGFLEFRKPEDATLAIAFDGIPFNGQPLTIKRPRDYIIPAESTTRELTALGIISTSVPDSPNKLFIGGLPTYLNDDQVLELLKSFGEIRAFQLVKDSSTQESKGFAFCEYAEASVSDIAVEGLHGMELGDRKLTVNRANQGNTQKIAPGVGLGAVTLLAGETSEMEPTRVLQMLNMVTPDDLQDPEEYEEICEDIRDECSKYGRVLDLKIPRNSTGRQSSGVGKVYVRFEDKEMCTKALRELAGRKFDGRTVLTSFYPEENYELSLW